MVTSSSLAQATSVCRPPMALPGCLTVDDIMAAISGCPAIAALLQRLDEIREIVVGKTKSHYTVEEVAAMSGRAPFTVRRWIKEGRLIATRIAGTGPKGRLLVAREDVQRLVTQGLATKVPAIDVEA